MKNQSPFVGQVFRTFFDEKKMPRRARGFPIYVSEDKGTRVTAIQQTEKGVKFGFMRVSELLAYSLPDFRVNTAKAVMDEMRAGFCLDEQWEQKALAVEAEIRAPKEKAKESPITFSNVVATENAFKLYTNYQNETALVISHVPGIVYFIPFLPGKKVEVTELPSKEFDGDWKACPWYPVQKAAALLMEYVEAGALKATPEAKDYLRQAITQKESTMATKIKKKTEGKKPAAKKEAPKTEKKVKAPVAAKEPAVKGPKVNKASTIRALIMEGKLTDNEIVEAVHKQFPEFTEAHKNQIPWYRGQLKRDGQNPPAAVRGSKE